MKSQKMTEEYFPGTSRNSIIQTDLVFETTSCQIGQKCIEILLNEFEKIQSLFPSQTSEAPDCFRQDFFERYGSREISLLTALDNESGVGFGALTPGNSDLLPLLDDLTFRREPEKNSDSDFLIQFRQDIIERALRIKSICVELTDTDLANFQSKTTGKPEHFYWLGSLIADSQKDLDQGKFKFVLKAAGGPLVKLCAVLIRGITLLLSRRLQSKISFPSGIDIIRSDG